MPQKMLENSRLTFPLHIWCFWGSSHVLCSSFFHGTSRCLYIHSHIEFVSHKINYTALHIKLAANSLVLMHLPCLSGTKIQICTERRMFKCDFQYIILGLQVPKEKRSNISFFQAPFLPGLYWCWQIFHGELHELHAFFFFFALCRHNKAADIQGLL